jgi:hypothetical protein
MAEICSRRPNDRYTSKIFSGLGDGLHKSREPVRKKSPSRARGQASNENKKFVVIGVPLPPSACNIILHTFILCICGCGVDSIIWHLAQTIMCILYSVNYGEYRGQSLLCSMVRKPVTKFLQSLCSMRKELLCTLCL